MIPPKVFTGVLFHLNIPVSVSRLLLPLYMRKKMSLLREAQWLLRTTVLLTGTLGYKQLNKAPPVSHGQRETLPQEGRSGSCGLPDEHSPSLCFSLPAASSGPLAGQLSPPDRKPGPRVPDPRSGLTTSDRKALGPPIANFRAMGLK